MIDVVADGQTPMISLASSSKIIEPVDAKRHWVFKTPQNRRDDGIGHCRTCQQSWRENDGVHRSGRRARRDVLRTEVSKFAQLHKITMVANERFNRTDTSVTGQVLKILAAKPDAVVVGAAGTPAALPPKTLIERGYKGTIYHNHGTGNRDFLRVVRHRLQRNVPANEPGPRRLAIA